MRDWRDKIINIKNDYPMRNFIEDYLNNPASAIASVCNSANDKEWCNDIDEELVYRQLSSGEFRLYEEMIFCSPAEDTPQTFNFATVA